MSPETEEQIRIDCELEAAELDGRRCPHCGALTLSSDEEPCQNCEE